MNEHKEQAKSSIGKLTVTVRSLGGKGIVRALRTQGKVPGVCYGASPDGKVEAAADHCRPQGAARCARSDSQAEHRDRSDDRRQREVSQAPRARQGLPGRRSFAATSTHVDLLAIDPNKEVNADVPIEFLGKPKGTVDGGQLRTVIRALTVRAKPSDIPVKLSVDVSPLEIGLT